MAGQSNIRNGNFTSLLVLWAVPTSCGAKTMLVLQNEEKAKRHDYAFRIRMAGFVEDSRSEYSKVCLQTSKTRMRTNQNLATYQQNPERDTKLLEIQVGTGSITHSAFALSRAKNIIPWKTSSPTLHVTGREPLPLRTSLTVDKAKGA